MSFFGRQGVHELIEGLRNCEGKESDYVSNALKLIKQDLSSNDLEKKSSAVLKLCYLHINGYNMRWAQFAVIEVMSHPKYTVRRPGFLACALTFDDQTDVALLATHIFKKSVVSPLIVDANMALNTLGAMCIPVMTEELLPDLITLLKSSRTTIRKKSIAAITRAVLKQPSVLDTGLVERLAERLADEDPAVQGAAVDSLLSLSKLDASKIICVAPKLFEILKDGTSWNWVMIKSLKLLGILAAVEPRVGKRFAPVVSELLNKTHSKAVEFEVARLVLLRFNPSLPVFTDAVQKLRFFVDSVDKNLRFVGLELLASACVASPESLAVVKSILPDLSSKALICASERDSMVRKQAIRIINVISDVESFPQIVNALLSKSIPDASNSVAANAAAASVHSASSPSALKAVATAHQIFDDIACGVLIRASQGIFEIIEDFSWYLNVLADLARRSAGLLPATLSMGLYRSRLHDLIGSQLREIAIRVPAVRGQAVQLAAQLLLPTTNEASPPSPERHNDVTSSTTQLKIPLQIALSCCWLLGEYGSPLVNPSARAELLESVFSVISTFGSVILNNSNQEVLPSSPANSASILCMPSTSSAVALGTASPVAVAVWSGCKLFLKTISEGGETVRLAGAGRLGQKVFEAVERSMSIASAFNRKGRKNGDADNFNNDINSAEEKNESIKKDLKQKDKTVIVGGDALGAAGEIEQICNLCLILIDVVRMAGNPAVASSACSYLLGARSLKASLPAEDMQKLLQEKSNHDLLNTSFMAPSLQGEDTETSLTNSSSTKLGTSRAVLTFIPPKNLFLAGSTTSFVPLVNNGARFDGDTALEREDSSAAGGGSGMPRAGLKYAIDRS